MVLTCERLDHFGRGIAYLDGKIVFINNFLPEEQADIEIIQSKKNYSIGRVVSFIKQSPDRVKPICPYLNCGCDLKHLKYSKQLEFKEAKIKNILEKYVHINPKVNIIVSSDYDNHYRNKITLKVNNCLGYYENNSNHIISIKKCELASEKVNEIIKVLNNMDLSKVKEITIKEFEQIMIIVKGQMDVKPLKSLVDSIYINDKLVHGEKYLDTKINGLTFKISKDSFFQVNKYTTVKLYDIVCSYLHHDQNKTVLDLYCGTGTITLLVSKYVKKAIGIEINKEAIECAKINKSNNHITNAEFICGDVSKEINHLTADIVIVDPPRSGLTEKGITDIIKINPEKLIYVSCDPMTLARDLNRLKEFYNIREVTPVDMFPNTHHVECVCLLERRLALIK